MELAKNKVKKTIKIMMCRLTNIKESVTMGDKEEAELATTELVGIKSVISEITYTLGDCTSSHHADLNTQRKKQS